MARLDVGKEIEVSIGGVTYHAEITSVSNRVKKDKKKKDDVYSPVIIRYLRVMDEDFGTSNLGGITIACQINYERKVVAIGYATANVSTNFCKDTGRRLAMERLAWVRCEEFDHKTLHVDYNPSLTLAEQFCRAAVRAPRICSATKEVLKKISAGYAVDWGADLET